MEGEKEELGAPSMASERSSACRRQTHDPLPGSLGPGQLTEQREVQKTKTLLEQSLGVPALEGSLSLGSSEADPGAGIL